MLIDDGGVFVAGLVDKGGCLARFANGVFFWIFNAPEQQWVITSDIGVSYVGYLLQLLYKLYHTLHVAGSKVIIKGNITVNKDTWYTLNLSVQVCTINYYFTITI